MASRRRSVWRARASSGSTRIPRRKAAWQAELQIPTYILVYDLHNRTALVDSPEHLCFVGFDLGSATRLPHARVSTLTQHVLRMGPGSEE